MRILKIILSIVATIVTAAAGAAAIGEIVNPAIAQLATEGAGLLALLGASPLVVSFATARVCMYVYMALGMLVAAHVGKQVPGPDWLFHVIAVVSMMAGMVGKAALRTPKPADPPGPGVAAIPPGR